MSNRETETHIAMQVLEQAYMDEYLRQRGADPATARSSKSQHARLLLAHAGRYASGKLAEVQSRSNLVRDLHSK